MVRRIDTGIDIAASAGLVWSILMDFTRYSEWNPFITSISGAPELGSRLEVRIEPPGGTAMSFKPKVLVVEPEREFRWRGSLLVPGVFDGEHAFQIEARDDAVRFSHFETFSGFAVPLLWGGMNGPAQRGFEAMNEALRDRAEGG